MGQPLIDYARYRRYYTRSRFVSPGRFRPKFEAPMGSFRLDLLTDAGRRIRNLLREYAGRPEKHRGAAEGSVYFKWVTAVRMSRSAKQWLDSCLNSVYDFHRKYGRRNIREIQRIKADPDLPNRLRIAADEIRDMGYDVEVVDMGDDKEDGRTYLKLVIRW